MAIPGAVQLTARVLQILKVLRLSITEEQLTLLPIRWKMAQGLAARWHVQVLPIREQKEELTSLLLPVEHTTALQGSSHPTILQVTANQGL